MRQFKKTSYTLVLPLFFFFSITTFIQSPVHAAAQGDGSGYQESAELTNSSSESRINETLAGLSDERVRQMLIEELKKMPWKQRLQLLNKEWGREQYSAAYSGP